MRKFLSVLAVLTLSATALSARPTGLSIGGGICTDFYNYSLSASTLDIDGRPFVGAFVEVGYAHEFTKNHTLYIGGRLSEAFDIDVFSNYGASGSIVSDRGYFDIPLKYQYQFFVSPTTRLFVEAGATANFWLVNYTRRDVNYVDKAATSETVAVNWFKDYSDYYNRANVALGGALGVYFNHVKIYAGYDYKMIPFIKNASLSNANCGQMRIGACYVF